MSELLMQAQSWPFVEARKLVSHIEKKSKTAPVVFQTGFGPSGLPHIGTFAEVTRTTFVRKAFVALTGRPTRLLAFSDDMDGLRKVPENLPAREATAQHLGKPLCEIPDPFGQADSFSDHMNRRLITFLEHYGLEHTFVSSQQQYKRGVFNDVLVRVLENVDRIKGVILPTLQPENRPAWSPFMPICEQCGRNLTTRVLSYDVTGGEVEYCCQGGQYKGVDGCGYHGKRSILNGGAKVGWKVDWALRWVAFDVDFEMYGKDLIESYNVSKKICRLLGGVPPQDYFYEMFLDEDGKKISKSVGKGLTIDEWLRYAPLESLAYYIYLNPRKAKRLYFDVIPKHVDEYLQYLKQYHTLATAAERCDNPVWFLHDEPAGPPLWNADMNFSLVQNLVNALGSDDETLVLDYIRLYDPTAQEDASILLPMVQGSMRYYQDHILPHKVMYEPSETEQQLIQKLLSRLCQLTDAADAEQIQTAVFTVAKDHDVPPRDFFKLLYQVMLGQESGPRLGAFIKLLGVQESIQRLQRRCVQAGASS